ncbi:MAG TPA: GAF domain-containing protein [Thermoanaerobaculia bacterium]|jgi:CheY-like chemotaxis protein|nr:GAF domain-containing protein [Thermoanaerobaculia bacterium]
MKRLALVVEKDGATRRLLGVLLKRFGFEVDAVSTVAEGLLLLEHVEYDAYYLDLLGAGGGEVLHWIATHRHAALTRCIVLSGAMPAQLAHVEETWPQVRTIRKPFELTEIDEVARRMAELEPVRRSDPAEEFARASVRLGAKAGVALRARGNELVPVLSFGYPAGAIAAFQPITLDKPYPLCAAYEHGRPLWLASVKADGAEFPTLVPVWAQNESRAVAALPLENGDGVIGAVGWSFREARVFDDAEREAFLAVARNIAHALSDGESRARSAS